MGDDTRIEWTDATWNPVRGCSRVSEGCRNCYAERVAARFSKPGMPYHGFAKVVAPRDSLDRVGGRRNGWTGKVALVHEKLDQPLRWTKPRRIFVNSMSDLFHEALSDEEIAAVFGVMAAAPRHTFQVLTKRPDRMRRWFEWAERADVGSALTPLRKIALAVNRAIPVRVPSLAAVERAAWPIPNIWLGVSCEDQKAADERIPLLLQTPAAVRFVSAEPLLGPIDLRFLQPGDPPTEINALAGTHGVLRPHGGTCERLDWVILGGESGPGARPCDIEWVRSIVRQCRDAGVACFVKQFGSHPSVWGGRWHPKDRKGGAMEEWPSDLRVREFPT